MNLDTIILQTSNNLPNFPFLSCRDRPYTRGVFKGETMLTLRSEEGKEEGYTMEKRKVEEG